MNLNTRFTPHIFISNFEVLITTLISTTKVLMLSFPSHKTHKFPVFHLPEPIKYGCGLYFESKTTTNQKRT